MVGVDGWLSDPICRHYAYVYRIHSEYLSAYVPKVSQPTNPIHLRLLLQLNIFRSSLLMLAYINVISLIQCNLHSVER